VATVTLDSPANRNALSARMLAELHRALGDAGADGAVRVIVLTATGTVFCPGADLKDAPETSVRGGVALPEVMTGMVTNPKPVVVRVNGHVRGGGMGLVASADVAIAGEDATFGFPEVRIGVVPAVVAVACRRVMTPRSLTRYLLSGEVFGAVEAQRVGLLTSVVDGASLDASAAQAVALLAGSAPLALARTKRFVDQASAMDPDSAYRHAVEVSVEGFGSEEAAEGIASFREKRPPRWAGPTPTPT
jgi:enoyl-CoA hydratase/carnithine racemase